MTSPKTLLQLAGAEMVHDVALADLADRFAIIACAYGGEPARRRP